MNHAETPRLTGERGLISWLRRVLRLPRQSDVLQVRVWAWARATFGERVAADPHERVLRVLEEAAELAQAEGLPLHRARMMVDYVYSRPAGDPEQETSGAYLTLLAYAEFRGYSLDAVARRELRRISAPSAIKACRDKAARKGSLGFSAFDAGGERQLDVSRD